ncbi:Serine/arginine repetitive matrix protein 1 [Liparis tanakae]|uniref:Serine/arginine repetitive matrix protein 1 n=1 Tax=Liparis tanakae TaxID=230148 RepID=A0A4Z2IZX6_9TELE|nr:Serine/arginine repetitive matrix protein 1 [Liparis tanakae]
MLVSCLCHRVEESTRSTGTSAEQDNRFSNKQKKLLKQLKFAECLDKKVDMTKVNLEVIKPWITQRVTEVLGFEDDVVIEFIFNQLEDKHPDSKMMQINLTGFLNGKNAREFMRDLWPLLLSAQENIAGIPSAFLEQKKEEIKQRQIEQEKLASLKKIDDDKKEKDMRERAQSKSPRRRKTRSPSPRRRSPVKRERKRSASRSPRRKASPVGNTSPPPPLMQLPTKPLEQIVESETLDTAVPEPVTLETPSTCDTVVEVVNPAPVTEVKEASPEKTHKKEERPRSREREKDGRRERPHHRSRSHSRTRRRRSRSRSYSPRRRQSPRRRMSPRRRSPPRRGPPNSRHRPRRSPVRSEGQAVPLSTGQKGQGLCVTRQSIWFKEKTRRKGYRVFLLRRRGTQEATSRTRCRQKWGSQEETQPYTLPTEAAQRCFAKVPTWTISKSPASEESSLQVQICFPPASSSETSGPCICLPLAISLSQWVPTTGQKSQQCFRQSIPKQGLIF